MSEDNGCPNPLLKLTIDIEKVVNSVEVLHSKHDLVADDITKIKEAVYNPDEGLYARIRALEAWNATSTKMMWILFTAMVATIVSSIIDDNLSLASRNVPYVSLVKANSCSVKDLFDNELILADVSGLEDLSNRFGGKN